MVINMINHEFDVFINDDSEILILGSFPSVKSREYGFYYMHKSNRFYRILSSIFNDFSFLDPNIEIKKNALKTHKIALYDVVESCSIILSDDSTIENVKPIDLISLLKKYNKIKKIYLNGKKAYELFIRYFSFINIEYKLLPSTSPRNASFTLEKLIDKWIIIKS